MQQQKTYKCYTHPVQMLFLQLIFSALIHCVENYSDNIWYPLPEGCVKEALRGTKLRFF